MLRFSKKISLLLLLAISIIGGFLGAPAGVDAVTAGDWKSGRIIDDSYFYKSSDLSADSIQAFFNAKMPSCDTQGSAGPYYDKYGVRWNTRADYGRASGYGPPYTCLKDYADTYGGKAADAYCQAIPGGTKSAAHILYDVSNACGISAKVLIVMLEKEQGLISDDWPWSIQYRGAMGYGCPDTAPCDAEYYGLFNQLYNAARQFKLYAAKPQDYRYKPYVSNSIYFHPDAACGSSGVYIENKATAGLYNYTPYQPNSEALNNINGSGDACSSYGNRNFWRLHNDWFGTTRVIHLPGCEEATNTSRTCIWSLTSSNGKPYYTSSAHVRDALVNQWGYQYQKRSFFGNTIQLSGNVAIYRLITPGGGSFLTADKNEYDALAASGYSPEGIDFWADPGNSNSGYPVYRLYSPSTGTHQWTSDGAEINSLASSGYGIESVAFTSISPVRQEAAPPADKELVYRFYMPHSYGHFWTTSVSERDGMISAGYPYEGVAWLSTKSTSNQPVYRLYNHLSKQHLYTTDAYERYVLSSNSDWRDEGTAYYVSKAPTSQPVYRLYSPSLAVHHITLDAYERNVLVSQGWRDEGVAWYQP